MRGRKIIREMMRRRGITNTEYAKMLGVSKEVMWERINNRNRRDIPVCLLSQTVKALGYKVVVVPERYDCDDNSYEVSEEDEEVI